MKRHIINLLALAAFVLACVASIAPQAVPHVAMILAVAAIGFAAIGFIHHLRTRVVDNTQTIIHEAVPLHKGSRAYKLDFAIADGVQAVLVKKGSDDNHVDVCGAGDIPLGVIYNDGGAAAAIGETATVHFLGRCSIKLPATAAIAINAAVFTAADGKAQPVPTASGTYYMFGRALTAALAAGDVVEIETLVPLKTVGLALFGNTNGEISALTSSATTTQAEFNALRDKLEEVADDLRALQTALGTTPAQLILGLAS